jgi:hypothetical protein
MMDDCVAELRTWRKETTACQEATEACLESKEPTSLKVESDAEHKEVPKEDAAMETFGTTKKRHGDRVEYRGKPNERAQGNGGSRKKSAAACRGMTGRAIPAQCKGHGRRVQGPDNVARGTPEGPTFGKRRRSKAEDITGIRN